MARSTRHYYLRDLKQVSYALAQQESWKKFSYHDIKRALIKFATLYADDLDDYIRNEAAYGCPIRDEAFDKYVQSIAALEAPALKPIDIHLGRRLNSFKEKPENFNEDEAGYYKRIRLLAETNANFKDVERNILKEPPYDPHHGIGDKNLVGFEAIMDGIREIFETDRILVRPWPLQYIPGTTEATKELHYILTKHHQRYGYDA